MPFPKQTTQKGTNQCCVLKLAISVLQTECLHLAQNSYVEIRTPNVMVLGGDSFGK